MLKKLILVGTVPLRTRCQLSQVTLEHSIERIRTPKGGVCCMNVLPHMEEQDSERTGANCKSGCTQYLSILSLHDQRKLLILARQKAEGVGGIHLTSVWETFRRTHALDSWRMPHEVILSEWSRSHSSVCSAKRSRIPSMRRRSDSDSCPLFSASFISSQSRHSFL